MGEEKDILSDTEEGSGGTDLGAGHGRLSSKMKAELSLSTDSVPTWLPLVLRSQGSHLFRSPLPHLLPFWLVLLSPTLPSDSAT